MSATTAATTPSSTTTTTAAQRQLEKDLQQEVEKMEKITHDQDGIKRMVAQLQTQLAENQQVKTELDLATDTDIVYKLIGPALVKQDIAEAKTNVDKRITYIKEELQRQQSRYEDLSKQALEVEKRALAVQTTFQKLQQEGKAA